MGRVVDLGKVTFKGGLADELLRSGPHIKIALKVGPSPDGAPARWCWTILQTDVSAHTEGILDGGFVDSVEEAAVVGSLSLSMFLERRKVG